MADPNVGSFAPRGNMWAMLRDLLNNQCPIVTNAGAPTSGTSGTFANFAGPGSILIDYTNGQVYVNTNTLASPTWSKLADAAGDITLTNTHILVGNASNVAVDVAASGDLTLSNTGAFSLAAGAVKPPILGISVINKSGSDILTDQLVAISGADATSALPKIVLADADVAGLDNIWVTTATIANNATGTVYKGATSAANLNTNSFAAAGDAVYLSTTAGGFTQTAPTTAISRVVPVGMVLVKSATVGQILWSIGPVRIIGSNEIQALGVVPGAVALANTHILVGNAGGAAADVALSGDATMANTGALTIANNAVNSAKLSTDIIQKATGTISSANITGASAGQFGHGSGVVLVAAPGANLALQLIACSFYYTFATAAYTAGGNITVNWGSGGAAMTQLISAANSVGAASNKAIFLPPIGTVAIPIVSNASLNLVTSAAFTQPGTAAGTIAWEIWYRVMAVGF